MARVGLMGGTFNPPHIGHLICAQEAALQLKLDRVLFVPVHSPPHKSAERDPGVEHRLEMCRLAIDGDERFEVSRIEAERPGPSFTVDTLRLLHEQAPEQELIFIVGGDMAYSLPLWRQPDVVLELAVLAVAEREGVRRMDIAKRLSTVPGAGRRVRFFDMPRVDVSSSLLRRRAAAALPLRYLTPDPVVRYVAEHELYAAEADDSRAEQSAVEAGAGTPDAVGPDSAPQSGAAVATAGHDPAVTPGDDPAATPGDDPAATLGHDPATTLGHDPAGPSRVGDDSPGPRSAVSGATAAQQEVSA